MNQLLVVSLLVGIAVIGVLFIMGAAAQPSDAITAKVSTVSKEVTPSPLPLVGDGKKQEIYLKATQYGTYDPNYLVVKRGTPVRIHFSADGYAGCGRQVVFPEFNVKQLAPSKGEALIEFTPQRTGKFPFNCPMRMIRGTIEVVE